jgi:hypothetical protein
MCYGVPIFADNKKALYGKGTNSHATAAMQLGISEDDYLKFEYHWWDKRVVMDEYDSVGEEIIKHIDKKTATRLANELVKKKLRTQDQLAKWLKGNKEDWGRLMEPEFKRLAKKVNPNLVIYQEKIAAFEKEKIEKYNP